jgi:hypothetical protein
MGETFFAEALIAAAIVLAIWTDVRLGRGAPAAVPTVLLHLGAATLAVMLAPQLMLVLGESMPLALVSVFGVFLPALVYLFLTAVWALKLIQRSIAGTSKY